MNTGPAAALPDFGIAKDATTLMFFPTIEPSVSTICWRHLLMSCRDRWRNVLTVGAHSP